MISGKLQGNPEHLKCFMFRGSRSSGVLWFNSPPHVVQFDGSLVVVPILSPQQVVLGTISVDTLHSTLADSKRAPFQPHQISFLQGVGLCLGAVQHWISVHQKLLLVAQSALTWIHRRCPVISNGDVYIVQPTREAVEGEGEEEGGCRKEGGRYYLSLMLSTSGTQPPVQNLNKKLQPHENQFFDYLFECVENSEPVSASVYGQHHMAYPIRDHTGCAVALVDLCTPSQDSVSPQQLKEVTKMLKLLTTAFYKLSSSRAVKEEQAKELVVEEKHPREVLLSPVSAGRPRHLVACMDMHILSSFLAESFGEADSSLSVLFDQLMLTDLKDKVKRVNNK